MTLSTDLHQHKERPGSLKAWLIWALAALFYLYEFAVRVAPSVMVDDIQLRYQLDAVGFGSSMAAYYHIYGPMQIIVGLLLDYLGARYLLVFATLCVALGCFMPLWGDSVAMLTAARAVMGFGSAFAFVGAMYLATVWFPRKRLAFLSGLTTSLGMLGAIIGEAPLATVVNAVGWQHTFWYAGFLGFFVAAAIYVVVPNHPHWELAHREALLNKTQERVFLKSILSVVKNPQCWLIAFVACTLYAPLAVFADLWGTEYIQAITHASRAEAAGASSMLYVGWLIGGPLAGVVSDLLGKRKQLLIVSTGLTSVLLAFFFSRNALSLMSVYSLLGLIGLSSSMQVICFVANMEASPHFARGSALAVTNMVVSFLGGAFQLLVGFLLNTFQDKGPDWALAMQSDTGSLYSATAFRLSMWVLPILAFCGFLVCFRIKEKHFQAR